MTMTLASLPSSSTVSPTMCSLGGFARSRTATNKVTGARSASTAGGSHTSIRRPRQNTPDARPPTAAARRLQQHARCHAREEDDVVVVAGEKSKGGGVVVGVSRRWTLTGGATLAGLSCAVLTYATPIFRPPPAMAFDIASYLVPSTDRTLDIEPLDVKSLEERGWSTLDSGVTFIVDRVGEGNVERGILDTVDHFVPGPFVEVKYTAYTASDGRAFASTSAARRPYTYQAGVKDEVQDEPFGGVMGMRVGERRRFAVPPELCYKRKIFGQVPPARDSDYLLVDVELLALQPY